MTTKSEAVGSALNNNMQDALAVLINKTVGGIDAASGFLQEQIPDVIHQLLMWKMCEALFIGGTLVTATTICVLFIWRCVKKATWEEDDLYSWLVIIFGSLGAVLALVTVVLVPSNLFTIIQIWLAPKVWLIEYAARLVK